MDESTIDREAMGRLAKALEFICGHPTTLMDHHMIGPVFGNLIIVIVAGVITVGCFVAMFWMLLRPGETDRHHPKHDILRDDR